MSRIVVFADIYLFQAEGKSTILRLEKTVFMSWKLVVQKTTVNCG